MQRESDAKLAEKGSPIKLKTTVEYSSGAIVSKTLMENSSGTITIFAFDQGQGLSEHSAPFDAVVQIIEGQADIVIGGKSNKLSEGDLIIMPANIPHAVATISSFKMLLTMIRGT